MSPRELTPCGTIGAARRHERANEPKCEPCATVWAEHQAAMYQQRQQRKREAAKRHTNRKGTKR